MGLHNDVQGILPKNISIGYDNQKITVYIYMRIDIIYLS